MVSLLIYGAGSIGNHFAYAGRSKGWKTTVYDIDPDALIRMRRETYPSRYDAWDNEIDLLGKVPDGQYDVVIIGTPPDTHLQLAGDVLIRNTPHVLLIEKPVTTPDDELVDIVRRLHSSENTHVLVGYNHNLTRNTIRAEELISSEVFGKPVSLHVRWLEHWGGIFRAHPWLDGPQDCYLGNWRRGGGACSEHSHAISIWDHFSRTLNEGPISRVQSTMDMYKGNGVEYDRTAILSVKSERGLSGSIILDVVSAPTQKMLRLQAESGFLEWHVNIDDNHDAIIYSSIEGKVVEERIPKTRPDDFQGEIDHIEDILSGRVDPSSSPIHLNCALRTQKIISGAHRSRQTGTSVTI